MRTVIVNSLGSIFPEEELLKFHELFYERDVYPIEFYSSLEEVELRRNDILVILTKVNDGDCEPVQRLSERFPEILSSINIYWVLYCESPIETLRTCPGVATIILSRVKRKKSELSGTYYLYESRDLLLQFLSFLYTIRYTDILKDSSRIFIPYFKGVLVPLNLMLSENVLYIIEKHIRGSGLKLYPTDLDKVLKREEAQVAIYKEFKCGDAESFSRYFYEPQWNLEDFVNELIGKINKITALEDEIKSHLPYEKKLKDIIDILSFYVEDNLKKAKEELLYDYNEEIRKYKEEFRPLLSEFEGYHKDWLIRKKQYYLVAIIIMLLGLILSLILKNLLPLSITGLLELVWYILGYLLPLSALKKKFNIFCTKSRSMFRKLLQTLKKSTTGWIRAHFLYIVNKVKIQLENIGEELKSVSDRMKERFSLEFPSNWKIEKKFEFVEVPMDIEKIMRKERDVEEEIERIKRATTFDLTSQVVNKIWPTLIRKLNFNKEILSFEPEELPLVFSEALEVSSYIGEMLYLIVPKFVANNIQISGYGLEEEDIPEHRFLLSVYVQRVRKQDLEEKLKEKRE